MRWGEITGLQIHAQKSEALVAAARSAAWRIYLGEGMLFTVYLATYALFAAHLLLYPTLLGIEVVPHAEVPVAELTIFEIGFSAMVLLCLIETAYASYLVVSTRRDPFLIEAIAEKLKGNIGVLLGEYTVVGLTYWMLSTGRFPVFRAPLTGRRFQSLRLAQWAISNCGLIYLDCRYILGRPLEDFAYLFGLAFAMVLCGLAAAIAPTNLGFFIFGGGAWYIFAMIYYQILAFEDKNRLVPAFGEQPMSKDRLITMNFLLCAGYGTLFFAIFMTPNLVSQKMEQLGFSLLDVVMKMTHCGNVFFFRAKQRPRLVGFRMPYAPDTASICLVCYVLLFLSVGS